MNVWTVVSIGTDYHENIGVLRVKQVSVDVEEILFDILLIDGEGILQMSDARFVLSVGHIKQC